MSKKHVLPTSLALFAIAVVFASMDACKLPREGNPPTFGASPDTVIVERVVIIDTTDSITHGNGDGQLNPGERVKILPRLRNIGTTNIPATVATLATTQSEIDIIDNTASYPPIGTGNSVLPMPGEFFLVEASNELSAPLVNFTLTGREDSQIRYQVNLSLENATLIYACIDTIIITRNKFAGSQPDELLLRLSICNNTDSTQKLVGVKIPVVALCAAPSVTFTALPDKDKVFFGDIHDDVCRLPANDGCDAFIYKADLAGISGDHCIRFSGDIHIKVNSANCNWDSFESGRTIPIKPCSHLEIIAP